MDRIPAPSPLEAVRTSAPRAARPARPAADPPGIPAVTDGYTPGSPVATAPAGPALASTPPAAASTTVPGIDDATLERLILGSAPSTAMDHFFGRDADRLVSLARVAATPEKPQAGLGVVTEYPPHVAKQQIERVLPDDAPVGWSSAWNQACREPFGTWTRQDGAWESACHVKASDPKSQLEESLLTLRAGDDGSRRMVLWERLKGGGGIFYRLDADAWLENPSRAPRVLEAFPYRAGAPVEAPFYHPAASPASEVPGWTQLFGPNSPRVVVSRFAPTEHVPRAAGQVDLSYEWGAMRTVHLPLRRELAPGQVQEGHGLGESLWLKWTRTVDGWESRTSARVTPDHFERFSDIALETRVDDEGGVRGMVLRSQERDGRVTEYVLDAADYLAGRTREPRVIDVRHGRVEVPVGSSPAPMEGPGAPTGPAHTGGINDQGDWIVIGGVSVPKNRDH